MQLTPSFLLLLREFCWLFTAPSYQTFIALLTGWCLSHRHRFIAELIQSSGCTHRGHHSRYHRFFSDSRWSLDWLWRVLAQLVIQTFYPTGLIELAGDDTLCRKRGLTIYGTGMHHDPKRPVSPEPSTDSLPPPPLRWLPAGATRRRVGFAPTGNRRLCTAHSFRTIRVAALPR